MTQHITKEQAVQLARKLWGESAILPMDDLHKFAQSAIQHYIDSKASGPAPTGGCGNCAGQGWEPSVYKDRVPCSFCQPAPTAGEQDLRDAQESPFEAWWESMGQYGRAGGSGYEKTFAWNAWCAALLQSTALPVGELTEDEWIEIGVASLNLDYNSDNPDGFLNAIKTIGGFVLAAARSQPVREPLGEMERIKAFMHKHKAKMLPEGACITCEGEGEIGGQFCGGIQECPDCAGSGKAAHGITKKGEQ